MDDDQTSGRGEDPSARVSITSAELDVDPPYRLDLTVWVLRRRARNAIDRWDGAYRRALVVGDRAVAVEVAQHGTRRRPVLSVAIRSAEPCLDAEIEQVIDQVRGLLGVGVDVAGFFDLAAADPRTAELAARFGGVRPPRFPTLFEALANAVANQQLSLEVGLTLLNRLTERYGLEAPGGGALRAFPEAEAIIAARPEDLCALGFSARKADYLRGLAEAVATGTLDEASLITADRGEATRMLLAQRGIGRWSAEYVLLRGLGRTDVYPGDDVGARNKLRRFFDLDHDPGYEEIADRLQPWSPYAGMIYFCLLLDGLDERGELPR